MRRRGSGTPPWPWLGPSAGGAVGPFEQVDRFRRRQGAMLDALGWGPIEAPYRIVFSEPGVELRAYGGTDAGADAAAGPVLLIVPAPIKRAYIWDLSPPASAVRACLRAGVRVYLMAWTEPGAGERGFGLAEYADRLIRDCLDAAEAETGAAGAVLAGHSLGGTLAAIFAALHPERVRGLVLLEAPLRFGGDAAGAFAPLLALAPRAASIAAAVGGGTVPGSFLDVASIAASPATFGWERWLDSAASWGDREALDTHIRVERWTLDELPLPARLFEEIVELLYREDRFMAGTLTVGGRIAAPERVGAPLVSVIDPWSRIIPPASVLSFHDAARSRAKRLLRYGGDTGVALQHVGVLVGRSAHRELWPQILAWMRERWEGG